MNEGDGFSVCAVLFVAWLYFYGWGLSPGPEIAWKFWYADRYAEKRVSMRDCENNSSCYFTLDDLKMLHEYESKASYIRTRKLERDAE